VRVAAQIMRSAGQTLGIQGFPGDVERVVVLRNGASLRVRPIRPDDAPRLMALCHRLSPRTVYQRFFSPRRLRPEKAYAFANVDYRERMALVAEVDTGPEPDLIGVARYGIVKEAAVADIGLGIEDGWQGLGLGPILLKEILHAGAQRGIRHFRADVLTENRRALCLLAPYTHIAQSSTSDSVTSIAFRRRENSAAGALKPWGES
jgi:GNAT superfamily N-acetyltransferase